MFKIGVFLSSIFALVACQKNGSAPGATQGQPQSVDPVEQLAKNNQPLPLTNKDIQNALEGEMSSIGSCYQLIPQDDAQDAPSTVETEFLVMPTGEPVDIKTWGMTDPVNDCVAQAIAKVRFPTFEGSDPMGVQYPFEFAPEATPESTTP